MSTDIIGIGGDGGQPYPLVRCKTCDHKAPGNAVCQFTPGISCGGPTHCVLCRRPVVTEDTVPTSEPITSEQPAIEPSIITIPPVDLEWITDVGNGWPMF